MGKCQKGRRRFGIAAEARWKTKAAGWMAGGVAGGGKLSSSWEEEALRRGGRGIGGCLCWSGKGGPQTILAVAGLPKKSLGVVRTDWRWRFGNFLNVRKWQTGEAIEEGKIPETATFLAFTL